MKQKNEAEDMPLVSVIIPTYNRADKVVEAIDSVLSQTYKDFEIIVIDDGSTDGTDKAVSQFRSHMKYIWQPNRGVAFARNEGIKQSQGELIAFLDSDDRWLPAKLEKQIKLFASSEKIGLVYSDYYRFDHDGRQPQSTFQWKKAYRGNVVTELLRSYFVRTSTVLVKQYLIQKVGLFDQGISPSEDYDMWLRLAEVCHFDYVNEPLVEFRIDPKGISKKDLVYSSLCHLAVLKKFKSNHNNLSNRLDKIINNEILNYYYQAALLAIKSSRYQLALDCLLRSLKIGFSLPKRFVLLAVALIKLIGARNLTLDGNNLSYYSNIPYLLE